MSQIDIAHRVSEKGTAPIIVSFNRKADRTNFHRQKNKLLKVRANDTVKSNNDDRSDSDVSLPGLEQENSYIYMNESLTSMSRKESKRLKYKFPGCTINGQLRVKKSKRSEYVPINDKEYLVNIT